MVQTNTVEAPGAGDAGVIRIKGSKRGAGDGFGWNWVAGATSIRGWVRCMRWRRGFAEGGLFGGATPVAATNCPEFWESREAAHHVAVFARWLMGSPRLRRAGGSDHGRQCEFLQRDSG